MTSKRWLWELVATIRDFPPGSSIQERRVHLDNRTKATEHFMAGVLARKLSADEISNMTEAIGSRSLTWQQSSFKKQRRWRVSDYIRQTNINTLDFKFQHAK